MDKEDVVYTYIHTQSNHFAIYIYIYIYISNHSVVHLGLIQCYMSITSQSFKKPNYEAIF